MLVSADVIACADSRETRSDGASRHSAYCTAYISSDCWVPQMFVSIRQAKDRLYSCVHVVSDNVVEINVSSESVVV